MKAWIYILHFGERLAHALHYVGTTTELRDRLTAHANGQGSRLCGALADLNMHWCLSALFQVNAKDARNFERQIKDRKHTPAICPLCSDSNNTTLPFKGKGLPYDLSLLRFPANSEALRTRSYINNTTSFSRPEDNFTLPFVKAMMSSEKDALGFVPISTEAGNGMQKLLNTGRIIIAKANETKVGYMAYSSNTKNFLTIHQAVTRDAVRLSGHGRRMLEAIMEKHPKLTLMARVRNDLPANLFWKAMGFQLITQEIHKTSESKINVYRHLPKES